jgi:hypothetical protein
MGIVRFNRPRRSSREVIIAFAFLLVALFALIVKGAHLDLPGSMSYTVISPQDAHLQITIICHPNSVARVTYEVRKYNLGFVANDNGKTTYLVIYHTDAQTGNMYTYKNTSPEPPSYYKISKNLTSVTSDGKTIVREGVDDSLGTVYINDANNKSVGYCVLLVEQ